MPSSDEPATALTLNGRLISACTPSIQIKAGGGA